MHPTGKSAPKLFTYLSSLIAMAALCFTSFTTTKAAETSGIPQYLWGTWVVTEVMINELTNSDTVANDPITLGRLFTIDSKWIHVNIPGDPKCSELSKTFVEEIPIEKLLNSSIAPGTVPSTYKLPYQNNSIVKLHRFNCGNTTWYQGLHGMDRETGTLGAWLIPLPEDKLAVRWEANNMLTLAKLGPTIKPSPSFDCAKASKPSENAICRSIGLSYYDTSISASYKAILNTKNNGKITRLKQTQKEWITQRDKCGSDQNCLEKEMYFRLLAINEIRADEDIQEPRIPLCERNCP